MTIGGIISAIRFRDGPLPEDLSPPYTRPPNGMAASDPHPRSNPHTSGQLVCLGAGALAVRISEEINRAGRHGTPLSCLLVVIDNLSELAREHGAELTEQTFSYIAAALAPELRGFDRIGRPSDGELLLLLPGADGPRGEMVARRVLDRLRTIKVEAEGMRRALRFSVGLAAWSSDVSGEDLMAQARAATLREQAEDGAAEPAAPATPDISSPPAFGRQRPS
jgi:diguanylate cyclase (GGDEF)-like protein